MNLQTRVKRSEQALASPIADELVMFDTGAGKYYGFNEIATAIWNRLEEPASVDALCTSLTEAFDVEPDQCRKEVLEFLPVLMKKGLIEEAG